MNPLPFVLPLLAAMVYSVAALFLNAAGRKGVKGLHATAVCNLFLGLFFLIFYDWKAFPALAQPLWPVLLLAALFVLGQAFTILAFSLGDVSIVASVMGLKVIFVNILLAIGLREGLSGRVWLASALSVLGVFILQSNPGREKHSAHALLAIFLAFLSAFFFAGADVLIQHWTPTLGFERFLPPAMLLAGLFSLLFFLPWGPSPHAPPRSASKLLLPGALLLALQSLLLIFAIARFGKVAEANILYSSRGVWSVLAVWLLGHFFANIEFSNHGRARLLRRLLGSALITAAIILTVLG